MGFRKFTRRFKNKPLLIRLFLSSISFTLFTLLVFFVVIMLSKKYRDIAASFGIDLQEECNVSRNTLSCSYINLSGKDFKISIQNLSSSLSFGNLLKGQPFLNINAQKADIVTINDPDAPPSDRIKGLVEGYLFSSYTNLRLAQLSLKIKNLDKDTDLLLDIRNISNRKNNIMFDMLRVNITREGKEFDFYASDTDSTLITIYPSSVEVKHMNLERADSSLRLKLSQVKLKDDKLLQVEGSLNLTKVEHEDIVSEGVNSGFKLVFQPEKVIKLSMSGSIENLSTRDRMIRTEGIGFRLNAGGSSISELKVDGSAGLSGLWINKKPAGEIRLDYRVKIKDDKVFLDGDITGRVVNAKLSYTDNILQIRTQQINIANLKQFFEIPGIFKNMSGGVAANIRVNTAGDIIADIDVLRLNLDKVENLSGKVSLVYTKNKDVLSINSFLANPVTRLNLTGNVTDLSGKPYLNLKGQLSGLRLGQLSELGSLQMDGDADLQAVIYGPADRVSVTAEGFSKFFQFEEMKLKDINFKLNLTSNILSVDTRLADGTATANITADLEKEDILIKVSARNFSQQGIKPFLEKQSDIFSRLNIHQVNGNIDIHILKDDLKVDLNLKDSLVSFVKSSPVRLSLDGYITSRHINMNLKAAADVVELEGHRLENFQASAQVKDDDVLYTLSCSLHLDEEKIDIFSKGRYNTQKNSVDTDIRLNGAVKVGDKHERVKLLLTASGGLDNLTGKGEVSFGDSNADLSINVLSDKDGKISASVSSSPFSYQIDGKKFQTAGILARLNTHTQKPEDFNAQVYLKNLSVTEKDSSLVSVDSIELSASKDRVSVNPAVFYGVTKGKIEKLVYDFKNDKVEVVINGEVDKKYLSDILKMVNIDGQLRFSFSYSGNPKNIKTGYNLKVYSSNLGLRVPYVQSPISFSKFDINAKDYLQMDIQGVTRSTDGQVRITGRSKTDFSEADISINTSRFPVKYSSIFSGVLDGTSAVKLAGNQLQININSQVSGRAKVEMDMFQQQNTDRDDTPEIIKKAKLELNISTGSPVFVEGSWGRAYMEGEVQVTGTVEKPVLNGKLRVSYGKVMLMRNIYNIDFLNIKITNNDIYVNGRLSTSVSGINIFVNVSGPATNLRYDFFSTPPKSREEILTLLLLKKTPEQLASTSVFGIIGKVGEMIIPFRPQEEEDRGLFGTGVNLNIIPSYSPVQGIVFSVYMQKYLTRRIYIGLSRPLSQYQLTNNIGWYEGGFRIRERTSFVLRSFENRTQAAEIMFTLPFDF